MAGETVRIGAVADVHYGRDAEKRLRPVFETIAKQIDILLLGGDLTDFGLPEEAQVLARDLTEVLTSMCARRYGPRSASRRARAAVAAIESIGEDDAP